MTVEIKDIPAVILAGGKGTRLQGLLLPGTPKCLAPLGDRVFLDILLRQIYFWGFRRAHLCLGIGASKVFEHFGVTPTNSSVDWTVFHHAKTGLNISTTVYPRPRGTAQALVYAAARLRAEHLFVLNGDTLIDAQRSDIEDIVRFHVSKELDATIGVSSWPPASVAYLFCRRQIAEMNDLEDGADIDSLVGWVRLAGSEALGSHYVDIGESAGTYSDLSTFARILQL